MVWGLLSPNNGLSTLGFSFRWLYDIGKNGWIVLIVFYSKKGEDGANKYNPLNEKPLAV